MLGVMFTMTPHYVFKHNVTKLLPELQQSYNKLETAELLQSFRHYLDQHRKHSRDLQEFFKLCYAYIIGTYDQHYPEPLQYKLHTPDN